MHVRHIEEVQKTVEVAVKQQPEDTPPLAEIVESLALLAAVHMGHHQPIKPPKAKDDEGDGDEDTDEPLAKP